MEIQFLLCIGALSSRYCGLINQEYHTEHLKGRKSGHRLEIELYVWISLFLIARRTKEAKALNQWNSQQYLLLHPEWERKVGMRGGFTAHTRSNNIAKIKKILIIFFCCLGFLWRLHHFTLAEVIEKGIMESGKNLFVTAKTWKIFLASGLGDRFQWKQDFSEKIRFSCDNSFTNIWHFWKIVLLWKKYHSNQVDLKI